MTAKVTGIEYTFERLNAKLHDIEGKTAGGLRAAGLKVQRLSQQRVPVEYGKLKASAYTRRAMDTAGIAALAVEVGFSAAYAIFVHENMEAKLYLQDRPSGLGHYWGPNGQPKFLESAVRELENEIVKTVADHAKSAKSA